MREWWSKLRASLSGRKALTDELDAEIQAHLQLEIADRMAAGMPHDQAVAAARKHFGSITTTKDKAREAWTFPRFETFAQDVRYALRGVSRSKIFSFVVILTFALGIGPTTAIFSVVYAALLRPLPYPAAERLVRLEEATPSAEGISVTWINFQHWRRDNHSFEDMAAYEQAHLTLTGRGDPVVMRAALVTSGFFSLLGKQALLGRVFTSREEQLGAPATAVLSQAFWASKLAGDPQIIGATLALDGRPYQVLGVLSAGPEFFSNTPDLYLPLALSQANTVQRSRHGSLRVLARLKAGVSLLQARTDLNAVMQHLAQADPGPESDHRVYGEFLTGSDTREIRPTLVLLAAAVGMVLLVACANVASLLLARGAARGREMAIRAAIGSGRARLARQLVTESLLLAAFGGLLGLLLAKGCLQALLTLAPQQVPRLAETGLDWQVLLFASAMTTLTGLLVGFAPVLAAGRLDLAGSLRDASRAMTAGRGGQTFQSVLVIAEIAITLVLCFASGLLLRSLIAAETAYPGFEPEHLLEVELALPQSSYRSPEAVRSFFDTLTGTLRSLPGVINAGAVNSPPSAGDNGDWFYSILGRPQPAQNDVPVALFNIAGPEYFQTMQIPLREGRLIRAADRAPAPLVAVVNEVFARRWWPHETAIQKQIKVGGPYQTGPVLEIVGVVGNVSQLGLDQAPLPEIYQPLAQSSPAAMAVFIRSSGDSGALGAAVRRKVAALDRNLPIQNLRPFELTLAATLERRRFTTLLLSLFAALAMVLAGVGTYGLLTFWVRVREGDIAIRMALGAERFAIVRWVSAQAFRLAAAGIAIGALAGWGASRWIAGLVFNISPRNPASMLAAAGTVLGIALLAAAVPAWRATRVDTLEKLHGS